MSDYFSDRENGPRARTEQVISPTVWAGLVGTVQALINGGAFGLRFPQCCPDGQATCGGDADALAASVPSLRERLETEATELNSIGNSHLIRHSEIRQVPVIDVDQVDYLFHRLFAMIQLMLRKKR